MLHNLQTASAFSDIWPLWPADFCAIGEEVDSYKGPDSAPMCVMQQFKSQPLISVLRHSLGIQLYLVFFTILKIIILWWAY